MPEAHILLEDGTLFKGIAIGHPGTRGGEICFNTGMTGYQEIYTDPSYAGQIVVNTTAHIGNYGTTTEEDESEKPQIYGLVVNEFSQNHSRHTAESGLSEYLKKHKVVGIAGVDTRALVRHIRDRGAMNAIISSELPVEKLQTELDKVPSMAGLELASQVCTTKPYTVGSTDAPHSIAALDVGVKKSILKHLVNRGCQVQVFPARTPFAEINASNPDGFFISNGPGDPAAMGYAVDTVREMIASGKPVFGICLGHQLMCIANGLATHKMHHGHRGLNHPVKNLRSGLGEITSQNHGFVVSEEDFEAHSQLEITHRHLNDKTIMGVRVKDKNVFSVQFHPEASPGPHDSTYLFDQFIELLKN